MQQKLTGCMIKKDSDAFSSLAISWSNIAMDDKLIKGAPAALPIISPKLTLLALTHLQQQARQAQQEQAVKAYS